MYRLGTWFKRRLEQALLLRGSRDFASREDYAELLQALCTQLNAGRQQRLTEERARLRPLPARRLESFKRLDVRVGPGSTIAIERNLYSVPARLIGEAVEARLSAESVQVWYGQQLVLTTPRLQGQGSQLGRQVVFRFLFLWIGRFNSPLAPLLSPLSGFRFLFLWIGRFNSPLAPLLSPLSGFRFLFLWIGRFDSPLAPLLSPLSGFRSMFLWIGRFNPDW